jgi:hypothetical protein
MKEIKLNIKEIVNENLNNKRNEILEKHFEDIDFYSTEKIINEHINKTIMLLNEGYDLNELDQYMGKANDAIKSVVGPNINYGDMFKDSMYSMAKEFAIKWILDFIGFSPSMSTYLAQGMADLSYKDVLYPFKNKEYCIKYGPNLLDAILEVIVRKYGHKLYNKVTGTADIDNTEELRAKKYKEALKDYEKDMMNYKKGLIDKEPEKPQKYIPSFSKHSYEWGDILQIGIGNLAGDFIRKTGTSEYIANAICPILHK